jgi:glycosyltransferase involved in cell wall biosynthesis
LQKIDELELNNILMLPYQDSTTIPYSLTAGDLYLISIDKNMDGLISPCKTYSPLAAGRPIAVICPEQSFFNSLVTTGECGKCFQNGESQKLADFILYLSQNPELYKKMGKASREYFLSNFERKISTQTYYSLIKSIISKEGLSPKS